MKNILMFTLIVIFTFISCDDDPTSPPVQPETPTVSIKSLKDNDSVYDSLYLDVETTGIENIVKVVAMVDGRPQVEVYNPPYILKFRPYNSSYYYEFSDSTQHNVYVKVFTNDDEVTYQSDVIHFTYYKFAITSLSVYHLSNSSVSLVWQDDITNLDKFIIERRSDNGPYSQIGQVLPTENQFIVTGLDTSQTYYFRIKAIKDSVSSYSREAKIVSVIGNIQLFETVSEGSSSLYNMVFNQDSSSFYTVDYDGYRITKWNASTRQVIGRINTNYYSSYPRLILIEDKNMIAVYSDYYLRIYRLNDGLLVKSINFNSSSYYNRIAYSLTTSRLYVSDNASLFCYDSNNDFNCIDTLMISSVRNLIAVNDKLVYTESFGTINLIDAHTNAIISSNYLAGNIYSMCIDEKRNEILLSTSNYYTVALYLNSLVFKEQFSTSYYFQDRLDFYKDYILGFYSSGIFGFNRVLKKTTMNNSIYFSYNGLLIDHKRDLILTTYDNQVRVYKFLTKWVDISTSNY